jgi:hypothetical protein
MREYVKMEIILEKIQDPKKVVVRESKNSTLQYDVSIKQAEDMTYTAQVLAWPDCVVTGKIRDEVITRIRCEIVKRLAQSEIVTIEIDLAELKNPWIRFAGMWADDPNFDEFVAELKRIRREANTMDYFDEAEQRLEKVPA